MIGKVTMSRDVFLEEDEWNWMEEKNAGQKKSAEQQPATIVQVDEVVNGLEDTIYDMPVRGTRSLVEVYERSNVVVLESANFVEAKEDQKWITTM